MLLITVLRALALGLVWTLVGCEGAKMARNGWSWPRKWQSPVKVRCACGVMCLWREIGVWGHSWLWWACALINNWLTEGFALGKIFKTECGSVSLQVYQFRWCHDLFCLSMLGICPTNCWNPSWPRVKQLLQHWEQSHLEKYWLLLNFELSAVGEEAEWNGFGGLWVFSVYSPWCRNKWRWLWCGDGMLGVHRVDRHC